MSQECFVYYRLPGDSCYTEIRQQEPPLALSSVERLNGRQGFVMAPFSPAFDCPVLLFSSAGWQRLPLPQPASVEVGAADGGEADPYLADPAAQDCLGRKEAERLHYHEDFQCFHQHILQGDFSKIVLARMSEVALAEQVDVADLFFRACHCYPQVFVALVSAPQCGTWLTATPEILLEGNRSRFHTIALAGTMGRWGATLWSEKNIAEQQFVADYISDCIGRFTDRCEQQGPYTITAGNLRHLRSDFRFELPETVALGTFLSQLHPTPAVSGLPKQQAADLIGRVEHDRRDYYSGFMGPLDIDGHSHLFVSLRCMRLRDDRCQLFAGGGLLADSVEEMEWKETEAKMMTMKKLLYDIRK